MFPSHVPDVQFVYNYSFGDMDVKAKIYEFYLKYIKPDSEFEINILDKTRKRFIDMMKDYDAWMRNDYFDQVGLYHFYDECIAEMKVLLIASLKRFKEYHHDGLLDILLIDSNNIDN